MKTWNVTINGKFAGKVKGHSEKDAAASACRIFGTEDHDCVTVVLA